MSLLKEKIELEIEQAELHAQQELSALPAMHKWIIIVCSLAIIPSYFIARAIARNLTLKNLAPHQSQAHPSFSNPKPPLISAITVTQQRQGAYGAVFEITNPNLDISLDQVPYQVNFYNAQKQQIYSYSDTLYLLPNQTKYLSVPTFVTTETIAYSNAQLPDNLPWQKRLDIPTVNISKSLPSYSQELSPYQFVVNGDFTNHSPYLLKKVRIVFLLYDTSGKIIGSSQRDEFSVASFERRAFSQVWPNVNGADVAKADFEVYTDNLDPHNLVPPQTPQGSASDLSRPK